MASILIVFGSTSDNTESVAQQIGTTLSNGPHTVAGKPSPTPKPKDLVAVTT